MSPAVAERPLPVGSRPRTIGRASASRCAPDGSDGGRLTLGRKLECVWEGLRADGAAECPVCHGTIVPRGSGSSGYCRDCDARIW